MSHSRPVDFCRRRRYCNVNTNLCLTEIRSALVIVIEAHFRCSQPEIPILQRAVIPDPTGSLQYKVAIINPQTHQVSQLKLCYQIQRALFQKALTRCSHRASILTICQPNTQHNGNICQPSTRHARPCEANDREGPCPSSATSCARCVAESRTGSGVVAAGAATS